MDPFDISRLRKNWDAASDAPAVKVPSAGAGPSSRPAAQQDAYVEARAILARVRAIAISKHAARREALAPFLDRADSIVGGMAGARSAAPDTEAATEPAADMVALRAELLAVLVDIEDLFEVFGACAR